MKYKIIVIPENGKAYPLTLADETIDVKTLDALVGGRMKSIPAMLEGTEIICNSEGKRRGYQPNECASDVLRSDIQNTVYGKAIWTRHKDTDFYGFPEEHAKEITETLNKEK